VAESPDERARWYKALNIVTADNTQRNEHAPSMAFIEEQSRSGIGGKEDTSNGLTTAPADEMLTVGGKKINFNTLTDICQFLLDQNNQLDS